MANFEQEKINQSGQNLDLDLEQNLVKKEDETLKSLENENNFRKLEKDLEEKNIFQNFKNESDELLDDVLDLSKESVDKISKEEIENLIDKQKEIKEKLETIKDESEDCIRISDSLENSLDILERLKEQLYNYRKLALDLDLDKKRIIKDNDLENKNRGDFVQFEELKVDKEKIFPKWYTQKVLDYDINVGRVFAINQYSNLKSTLNKYDEDFRVEVRNKLLDLVNKEEFDNEFYRAEVVKEIAISFLDKSRNNEELKEDTEEKVYYFFREDFLNLEDEERTFKNFKEFKESHPDVKISDGTYSMLLNRIKNNKIAVKYKPIKKTSFEEIEHKNPYNFVPEKFKNSPNLVVFDEEIFKMSSDEFANKFNSTKSMRHRLMNFYKKNGYAWFLSQENNKKQKRKKRTTCISYAIDDDLQRTQLNLSKNEFNETIKDNDDKNKYIKKEMKNGKEKRIEQYGKEKLKHDIILGRFFAINEYPELQYILNKHDIDFRRKAKMELEELINEEEFSNEFWRAQIIKDVGLSFLDKVKEKSAEKINEKKYYFFKDNFLDLDSEKKIFKTFGDFKEEYPEVDIKLITYNEIIRKIKNGLQEVFELEPLKISSEEIEYKNPYDFIPEKFKNSPNLVVFDKEILEMSDSEFMDKFHVSKNTKNRLMSFYEYNGYAWFLSQENEGEKNKTNITTCYRYNNQFDFYKRRYVDQMDRINEILKNGKEDNPIRYSAPVEDMTEVRLEDFFAPGITPNDIEDKYPGININYLDTRVKKMIHEGCVNIFVHKESKNKKRVQTRNINFLEIDGKKSFPEWYDEKMLKKDIRAGRFFAIKSHPVLRGILDKYDIDFKSDAQMRLFELAGEEAFENEIWRAVVVKNVGVSFLRKIDKLNKEVSINTKNRENEDFSLMDTVSAQKTGFKLEKNLIDEDTIEEVQYRIKPRNYEDYDEYEDDLEFVAEYLGQDYSTDAENEEDRKRWEKEAQEDKERFDKILKRNDINLEDLL